MIELEHISFTYTALDGSKVPAVHDVSFSVREGEFVALVGPSGCGKTTLLEIIAGLKTADGGEARLRDRPLNHRFGWGGYMSQVDTLLPWRTVAQNAAIGLEICKAPKEERGATVASLIRQVGLTGFEDKYPSEISGGMKKRLGLIRILAYDPEVLLLDEPFGALDAQTREFLQNDLLSLWKTYRKTVLFVTHDIAEAIALSDRILLFTSRPATLKSSYEVNLPRPRCIRDVPFDPEFQALLQSVRRDLMEEVESFSCS